VISQQYKQKAQASTCILLLFNEKGALYDKEHALLQEEENIN